MDHSTRRLWVHYESLECNTMLGGDTTFLWSIDGKRIQPPRAFQRAGHAQVVGIMTGSTKRPRGSFVDFLEHESTLDCVSAPFSLGSLTGRHGVWLVEGSANDHLVALDHVDGQCRISLPPLLKSCCTRRRESLVSVASVASPRV